METYEEKYKNLVKRLNKAREEKGVYTFNSVLDAVAPELAVSEDERIIERILFSLQKDIMATKNSGCSTKDLEKCIAWLEKQGRQKPLYIRFGDVPSNETSKIYRGEVEIGEENGVSVYPAFEVNGNIVLGLTLPITKTTLYTQQHLLEYDNRPCYLVSGDYVGKGTDGEPLIRNISIIKKLDNYRIKNFEKHEQKPIDKVEPKFKVGDIITNGILIGEIDEIHEWGYHAYFGDHYADVPDVENWHKWTIQDAKANAGYEGNADKKELKKIEQKSTIIPKFKVGDIIRHKEQGFTCKIIAVDTEYRLSGCNGNHLPFDSQDAYELVEQKPAEWTKEDKERYISCLQKLSTGNPEQPETINSKWFKEHVYSKPQSTWRPSDRQIEILKDFLFHIPIEVPEKVVLVSLYHDLLKLKE